jgi:hypothetical protein
MKSKAILFGINYVKCSSGRLRGSANDVRDMGKHLAVAEKYDKVKIYTDEDDETKTRGQFIINAIYKLALDSRKYKLKKVWIHFSGHGCGIPDRDIDEEDGKDECILPSDFRTRGVITDDLIKRVLRYFDKDTIVTCVFDCCHSGTIGDLKYLYKNDLNCPEEVNMISKCKANVCLIYGCMDNQTSEDAYNVLGKRKFSGAMTSCLLLALEKDKRLLKVMKHLRANIKEKGFTQYPQLSSSFRVGNNYKLQ